MIFYHFFDFLLLNSQFCILPSELGLLDHYMSQPDQDPEWVEFVRQSLETPGLSPQVYEVMVRDFLEKEFCFTTRDPLSTNFLWEGESRILR